MLKNKSCIFLIPSSSRQFAFAVWHFDAVERVSEYLHKCAVKEKCAACGALVSGHGLHGTCSIAGYKVCVGGRDSAVNECVSLCMLSTETYFCE